jgi:hypothetical protein
MRKPAVFWSRALSVAIVLFPLSLSKIDFRSVVQGGLSVSLNKASPAYAAFEDLRENYDEKDFEIPDNGIRLAAGQAVDMRLVRQVPRQRLIVMSGMTLHAPPPEPQPVAPPAVVYLAGSTVRAPRTIPVATLNHDPDSLLAAKPPTLAAAAPMTPEEFATVTPAQRARELIEQEIQNNPMLMAQYQDRTREIEKEKEEPAVATLANFYPNTDAQRPLWLNGQIEMTGGLAFTGPDTHIEVKRTLNGETLERGRIWVTEGKFEIHVKKAVGYLVAELQTRDGRVLGRGEMNLVHLTEIPRKDNRVNDIRLALRPTTEGAAIRPVSGYSYGQQKMPVADARVEIQAYAEPQAANDDGLVIEPSLNHASSFVARAVAKRHWSSLIVGQANHPQDIRLFSNSLVEALIDLEIEHITDRKEAARSSVVWGQLTKGGLPVEGGTVEMAGEYKAIYFNEMYLPDKNMKRTGKNGLFAFLKVKAGVQALRVRSNGHLYPAQIFPTENKHVSYVELEVREKVVSQFKVFDVLDLNKPVSARIRLVGTGAENELALNKNSYVEYSVASNHFMIEADAGSEYEVSRMTLTGAPHLVNVPLLKRDWIYSLYNYRQTPIVQGHGAIVGFIDDQDFEVELTGYRPGEPMNILYFDAEGKPLETKTGVAGGGFIIFNAPLGLQTIYIHPTQSRETYSQVVVAEPEYIHVVAWAAAASR